MGWPAALFVGLVLVIATVVVRLEGEWLPVYLLIGGLGLALIGSLSPASVRHRYGM